MLLNSNLVLDIAVADAVCKLWVVFGSLTKKSKLFCGTTCVVITVLVVCTSLPTNDRFYSLRETFMIIPRRMLAQLGAMWKRRRSGLTEGCLIPLQAFSTTRWPKGENNVKLSPARPIPIPGTY